MCTKDPSKRPKNGSVAKLHIKSVMGEMIPIVDKLTTALERHAKNLDGCLKAELERSRKLVKQVFPEVVANALQDGVQIGPEKFDNVTIYFSDIVGFTTISSNESPNTIAMFLDEMYTMFDTIIEKYDVFKVETIGDAYMLASGVPNRNGDRHADQIICAAVDIMSAIRTKEFT